MSKSSKPVPEESIALYNALVATISEVERKGKTTPYTSLNGHMFSFLSKGGDMGLRLAAADRETFIERFKTKLMEQHGRMMKDFVEVPKSLLKETETLSTYFKMSYEYTASLKPKPTKKK